MSKTRFPKLPPLVPCRGGKLSQTLFKQLFLAQGWQLKGEFLTCLKQWQLFPRIPQISMPG